jgi:hypothetical protein
MSAERAGCLCGGAKMHTCSIKKPVKEKGYDKGEMHCSMSASKLFSGLSMVIGVCILCTVSTQISHTPGEWLQMSQFLSYNGQDAPAVLENLMLVSEYAIGSAGLATFLSVLSMLAARKPVGRKKQYGIDLLVNSVACTLSVLVAFRMIVDVGSFDQICSAGLPATPTTENPSMNSAGHESFCVAMLHRMVIACGLFCALGVVTSFALLSNWCGFVCKCCQAGALAGKSS